MKAVIDNSYLLDWLRWLDKQDNEKRAERRDANLLMQRLIREIIKPDVQAGRAKWSKGRSSAHVLQSQYGYSRDIPGVEDKTWCIYLVYRILETYKKDVNLIIDQKYKKISYTTGNEMTGLLKKNCTEIGWVSAQTTANLGIPVVVAAKGKNTGHVAIVAPSIRAHSGKDDIIVGQAGGWNGFFPLYKAFPGNVVEEPGFFIVPDKK